MNLNLVLLAGLGFEWFELVIAAESPVRVCTLVIDSVLHVSSARACAICWSSRLIHNEGCHIELLIYGRLDNERVLVAAWTFSILTELVLHFVRAIIVNHEEIGTVPVGDIVCDRDFFESFIKISEGHVEFAIRIVVFLPFGFEHFLICSGDFGPASGVAVTELASPLVLAMRVSDSYELSSVAKLMGA